MDHASASRGRVSAVGERIASRDAKSGALGVEKPNPKQQRSGDAELGRNDRLEILNRDGTPHRVRSPASLKIRVANLMPCGPGRLFERRLDRHECRCHGGQHHTRFNVATNIQRGSFAVEQRCANLPRRAGRARLDANASCRRSVYNVGWCPFALPVNNWAIPRGARGSSGGGSKRD